MRPTTLALALLLAAAPVSLSPVWAAEHGAAEKGEPGTNVEMPFLMAPMRGPDGKLAGYAYISMLLTGTNATSALAIRDKLAFIQDAFVRNVNGISVAKVDNIEAVDDVALKARLLVDARKIMGQGKVASISIVQMQIAPLRPKTTPAMASAPAAEMTAAAAAPAKPAPAHH